MIFGRGCEPHPGVLAATTATTARMGKTTLFFMKVSFAPDLPVLPVESHHSEHWQPPSDQMSARLPTVLPRACSGDM